MTPEYQLRPRPCRYCQAPIIWMESPEGRWKALNPEGEGHSCLGSINPKRRKTHQFVNRRKEA